jgi:hypothetical protein
MAPAGWPWIKIIALRNINHKPSRVRRIRPSIPNTRRSSHRHPGRSSERRPRQRWNCTNGGIRREERRSPALLIVGGGHASDAEMLEVMFPAQGPPVCHDLRGGAHGFAFLHEPLSGSSHPEGRHGGVHRTAPRATGRHGISGHGGGRLHIRQNLDHAAGIHW